MIASENLVSPAVMAAMGSILTNKYAEGYPSKRYYGGCEYVDIVEDIARKRACELFGAGACQRTTPFWRSGQHGGLFCFASAWRYCNGDEPGGRAAI